MYCNCCKRRLMRGDDVSQLLADYDFVQVPEEPTTWTYTPLGEVEPTLTVDTVTYVVTDGETEEYYGGEADLRAILDLKGLTSTTTPGETVVEEEEPQQGQEFTSAGTSLNQVPALHKKLVNVYGLEPGTVNFDNGAGKFDKATDFFAENGVANVRYDPYNLPEEVNAAADDYLGLCDTSTCANVLNVIKEPEVQKDVLRHSKEMLKPGGVLYVSVYEGDRSGVGRQSKNDCWQNNMPLKDYLPVVLEVFDHAEARGGVITAWDDAD